MQNQILHDFQEACKRTRNHTQAPLDLMLNATMGLAGEATETLEVVFRHAGNLEDKVTRDLLVKEMGDIMWYVADYATTNGLNLEEVVKYDLQHAAEPWHRKQSIAQDFAIHITIFAGKLLEHAKKHAFHGKQRADAKEFVSDLLGRIMFYAALLAATIDAKLSYILDMNVEKLRQRWPDGFKVAHT